MSDFQDGPYFIGVDVGTASARAGCFDPSGRLLASATEPIRIWRPATDFAEQSSTDIWRAVCKVVKQCRQDSGVAPDRVSGISFDATCSLVALDRDGSPLPVNTDDDAERNIIMWMDHRALAETEEINTGGWDVLRYVGGGLSPEMECPKLLWIKRNLPETWSRAGKFFDLADYLTWRSSGVDAQSLCTVVCKWTYLGHGGGRWDHTFFEGIGLGDLFDEGKVGSDVRPMGSPLGPLTSEAADELGLTSNCIVGVGIIDAHAGGLGLLGAIWSESETSNLSALEGALAFIGGTSNCLMAVSREAKFIDGIWGPYFGAMVPDCWLTEAGQSAAGSAIDHIIADHANITSLRQTAQECGKTVYELLNDEVARLQATSGKGPELTHDLHVMPDFIGNRSPRANPHARGAIDGLSLDESLANHALIYYATIQGVAYGIRENIEAMNRGGYRIDTLFVTGGGTKNPLWLQEHADATGCTIVLPREPEAVLLGSAILAAAASGHYASVDEAMRLMTGVSRVIKPRAETAKYHAAKYAVFCEMAAAQERYRALMKGV